MKHWKSKAAALVVALFAVYVLLNHMNLNPLYPEAAFAYCVLFTLLFAIFTVDKIGRFVMQQGTGGVRISFVRHAQFRRWPFVIVGILWGAFALVSIGSSVLFQVNAFRDQMPELKEMNFAEDFDTVDVSQLPIVDEEMAKKLADKKLGERPSLGSQVVLGEPTLQQVNGELLWAVPTYHSGLFKWLTNMSGTPGYVTVSATNPQDVEYVDGYSIKYQPGAYLWQNLLFYARFTAAPFTGLTDYSFELDDTGRPYWVITTYRYLRGFSLPEATGAVVLDCATGESETYAIDQLPEWVDRVQPEDFIMTQLNNKGEYVHGYLNFSDKDKYRTSPGQTIIYNDGRCYLFTGLTSVGADESAIGFVMVDMVTKEPRLYRISGATEMAAQQSAQGKVQQYGYQAAFPLIVNMNGVPTYFMTLKDTEGLIKQYAYVSVEDYQTVAVGESISEARLNYEKAIQSSPAGQLVGNVSTEKEQLTGTVLRIGSEYNPTGTAYYLVLAEEPQLLFSVQGSLSDELALTREGDQVKVEYYPRESATQELTGFDNLEFEQSIPAA
ncbi:hypothetical protein WMO24_01290 [Ruthenibacterium sp. CLA-JM-H11]|uniref:CvpA family protein n=1 Tax=Ruthenibacterium intestinale TaxID=3133163 RepID=A0ABV1GB77_9FIRM